jgi:hypothetical protein
MAARGSEAKATITQKILETFSGSFCYDKEIRIPIQENGETVQIKVTLTAAKVNVSNGADSAMPAAASNPATPTLQVATITEQEKKETAELLASLNL